MRSGSSSSSLKSVALSLVALVVLTVGVGVVVHAVRRDGALQPAGTPPAAPVTQPDRATSPVTATQGAPARSPSADWIGFHNGGGLSGVAEPIKAPPMTLRWTLTTDDDPPPAPATGPTTSSAYRAPGKFVGGAAIVGGVVYIADTAGAVRAIDAATGKIRWSFRGEDGFETTPLVLHGRVLLGDLGGIFHAISTETGRQVWSFDAGGNEIHASANFLGVDRDRVVFATDGADIFCLDVATGTKIWAGKAGDRVNGAPAVANGSALVSGCDSQLRALKGTDGTEEFSVDLGAVCPGSPAVAGDNLVVGSDQGRVLCISAATHQQRWLFTGIAEQAMVYDSPAIAEGIVVFGARDRKVYGLELSSGKKIWSATTRGEVDSSPIISDGRVYIGSKDKKLYVLELKTGKMLWSFTAGRGISAPPAIGAGVLVIADEGGHLFCLE